MTISIIKLSSGETVMADVLSYDEETLDIETKNPLQITMQEDMKSRKMQMFSSAWIPLFGEDTHIEIRFDHIIAIAEAPKEMKEYYSGSLDEMRMKETSDDWSDNENVKPEIVREILRIANTSIH